MAKCKKEDQIERSPVLEDDCYDDFDLESLASSSSNDSGFCSGGITLSMLCACTTWGELDALFDGPLDQDPSSAPKIYDSEANVLIDEDGMSTVGEPVQQLFHPSAGDVIDEVSDTSISGRDSPASTNRFGNDPRSRPGWDALEWSNCPGNPIPKVQIARQLAWFRDEEVSYDQVFVKRELDADDPRFYNYHTKVCERGLRHAEYFMCTLPTGPDSPRNGYYEAQRARRQPTDALTEYCEPRVRKERSEENNLRHIAGWDTLVHKGGEISWKILPNQKVIRGICAAIGKVPFKQVLVNRIVPSHPYFIDYDVQGFQGQDKRRLVFRAYLPVTPKMQTLSVVATMRYVREHTSLEVDVPEVISYCADANETDLKFEYVLMRYPPGISLDAALPESSKRQRKQLAYKVARMYARCEADPAFYFNQLGSIYQSEPAEHEVDSRVPASFYVGYMLGYWFTEDKKAYMSRPGNEFGINAGPFESEFDLQVAIVDCHWKRLNEGMDLWFGEDFDESDEDTWEQYAESLKERRKCLKMLKRWKAKYTQKSFYLEKGSRTSQDILVDPVTFKITGLINWESTTTVSDVMRDHREVMELTFSSWYYIRDGFPSYTSPYKPGPIMQEFAYWFEEALAEGGRVEGTNGLRRLWHTVSVL